MPDEPPPESSIDKLKRLTTSESNPKAATESKPKPEEPAAPEPSPASTPPASAPPPPKPSGSVPAGQHPTGEPDLTGGWYRSQLDAVPPLRQVPIDEEARSVPRLSKVPEQDPEATRVHRGARRLSDSQASRRLMALEAEELPSLPLTRSRRTPSRARRWGGCVWRFFVGAVIMMGLGLIALVGGLSLGYWAIARTLPPVGDLQKRASQFETTRLYDAKGQLLYEIADPQAGFRTRVTLDKISPYLIAATIATEDKNFFSHPGFDPIGIIRAIVQNARSGESVSGASTITQQLVRALVLSPDERAQRTTLRKIREIILAAEITRRYSKEEILTLYLNEIYYGNLAYGIEAASETYFHKPASGLTLGEASFLAGLPQAPAVYDVFTNRDATLERQQLVLGLMLALSDESNCIPVSAGTPPQKVCVTAKDMRDAQIEMIKYLFTPPKNDAHFPHWVNYVRQLLEDQYGAQTVYRSGYNVYTTLDPDLQTLGETNVAEQVTTLADRHVTDGALVAIRPSTGEILAMVGSDSFDDPVDGQINMAIRPRQPGSSIKPLTYALAFAKGWTPATLIWDVPTEFPDGANPPYKPVNYDGRFHGPVLVRTALANSYNIPAVKALQFVGIYGDTGFIQFAQKLGITTLERSDYGLALTLGGGEVPLLQLAGAYGALANGGQRVFPVAIRQISDFNGKVICQQPLAPGDLQSDPPPCQPPPENWGQPIITPENAFLIGDILSDNTARTPAFGPNSPLRLSFPAAAKTGTTNDFRDNWTIGYTPDLVAGVWVGNADFTEMVHSTGVTGAAPIWHNFMEGALAGKATPFTRPPGIVEKTICGISGTEPSDFCPPNFHHTELFAAANGPLPKERDLWQQAFIDPFTGLRQTADCAQFYQSDRLFDQGKTVVGVSDASAQKWLTEDPNGQAWAAEHGLNPPITWAPTADCGKDSPHPLMSFAYPAEGSNVSVGPLQILGQAAATADFDHFLLEYGLSENPEGWGQVIGPTTQPVLETGLLASWDLSSLPDGPLTLRILVFSKSGGSAEARLHLNVQRPTATPTATEPPTLTPTDTETATPVPSATVTPLPSAALPPTETPTLTAIPLPTDTPAPTAITVPDETPSPPHKGTLTPIPPTGSETQ